MYIKRQSIQKFWPVPRKGTKFLAVPTHEKTSSVPLIVIIKEILKLVKNKKELKKLINDKKILVNQKVVRETNYPILLFDSISFPSIKKHYRATLKGKKMWLEEVSEKETLARIYKVESKKQLSGKKMQINLSNGKNILSPVKIKVGDFVILNNADNKILKTISLQKELEAVVVKGKHIGIRGKIKDIHKEGESEIAEIVTKERESIKVDVKNLFATG